MSTDAKIDESSNLIIYGLNWLVCVDIYFYGAV